MNLFVSVFLYFYFQKHASSVMWSSKSRCLRQAVALEDQGPEDVLDLGKGTRNPQNLFDKGRRMSSVNVFLVN